MSESIEMDQGSNQKLGFLLKKIFNPERRADPEELFGIFLGPKRYLVLVLGTLLTLTWFFSVRIGRYLNIDELYNDAKLFNLTKSKIEWDVYYGKSPLCGTMECFAQAGWPRENYQKQMILPAREFPLKDFRTGDRIYLRTVVEIPERIVQKDEPIALHSVYIYAKRYLFYLNDQLIADGPSEQLNLAIPRNLIPQDRKVTLAFSIDPTGERFQGIANRYDMLLGSKAILSKKAFLADEMLTTFYLWFLLPKIVFCALFAIVYLFVTPSVALFCFVFYSFFASFDTFLYSGFAPEMINFKLKFDFIGIVFRFMSVPFLIGFLRERRGYNHQKTMNYVIISLIIIGLMSVFTSFTLPPDRNFHLWRITHVLVYIGCMAYGAYFSYIRRESDVDTAVSIFFAFSLLPVSLRLVHVVSDWLGIISHLNVSWHWIHELIMFFVLTALAVIDVGRSLSTKVVIETELKSVNERLELARSVQRMLLPKEFFGSVLNYDYQFFYEPAEKMSGDWLHFWSSENETNLFLGDVVGKGPQAVLTVSIIASIINECKLEHRTVDDCIQRINHHLLAFFDRSVTTTLTVISVKKDKTIDIRNAGTIGWISVEAKGVAYHPMRGTILGLENAPRVSKMTLNPQGEFLLFAFTDGVLEGARPLKNLCNKLKDIDIAAISFNEVFKLVQSCGAGNVLHDDKTMLVLGSQRIPQNQLHVA